MEWKEMARIGNCCWICQFLLFFLSIYLATPGLSCSMRTLSCACGIQFPDQGLNPGPCIRSRSPSHWTTREVPGPSSFTVKIWSFHIDEFHIIMTFSLGWSLIESYLLDSRNCFFNCYYRNFQISIEGLV